jgi:hypothetical protein
MHPGILAFRSISYMEVEDNVQDFLGTIGDKRIYLYEERVSRDASRNPSVSLDVLYGGRGQRSGLSGYHRW